MNPWAFDRGPSLEVGGVCMQAGAKEACLSLSTAGSPGVSGVCLQASSLPPGSALLCWNQYVLSWSGWVEAGVHGAQSASCLQLPVRHWEGERGTAWCQVTGRVQPPLRRRLLWDAGLKTKQKKRFPKLHGQMVNKIFTFFQFKVRSEGIYLGKETAKGNLVRQRLVCLCASPLHVFLCCHLPPLLHHCNK